MVLFMVIWLKKREKREVSQTEEESQGGRERRLYDHPFILSRGDGNPSNVAVINRQNSPFPLS